MRRKKRIAKLVNGNSRNRTPRPKKKKSIAQKVVEVAKKIVSKKPVEEKVAVKKVTKKKVVKKVANKE